MSGAGTATKLGVWMCAALVVGNMIGSGVFLLPASLAPYGAISIAGWVATSIGAIALALVFGRLARLVPRTGGPYAYTREGFGEFAGFLVAWGYWIALWAGNAAVAVALTCWRSSSNAGSSSNRVRSASVLTKKPTRFWTSG